MNEGPRPGGPLLLQANSHMKRLHVTSVMKWQPALRKSDKVYSVKKYPVFSLSGFV
jgi:hypothetical protein